MKYINDGTSLKSIRQIRGTDNLRSIITCILLFIKDPLRILTLIGTDKVAKFIRYIRN